MGGRKTKIQKVCFNIFRGYVIQVGGFLRTFNNKIKAQRTLTFEFCLSG